MSIASQSMPPSPLSGARAMAAATKEREIVVLFQCQMWLYQKEEKRLRAKLNDTASAKLKNKVRLVNTSQSLAVEQKGLAKDLQRIEGEEDNMRQELDNLSHELMHTRTLHGEDSAQMRSGLERRKVLWDHLEELINRRNGIMRKARQAENAQELLGRVLSGVSLDGAVDNRSHSSSSSSSSSSSAGSHGVSEMTEVDDSVLSAVNRLKSDRDREAQLRQELVDLLHAREQLAAQFKWLAVAHDDYTNGTNGSNGSGSGNGGVSGGSLAIISAPSTPIGASTPTGFNSAGFTTPPRTPSSSVGSNNTSSTISTSSTAGSATPPISIGGQHHRASSSSSSTSTTPGGTTTRENAMMLNISATPIPDAFVPSGNHHNKSGSYGGGHVSPLLPKPHPIAITPVVSPQSTAISGTGSLASALAAAKAASSPAPPSSPAAATTGIHSSSFSSPSTPATSLTTSSSSSTAAAYAHERKLSRDREREREREHRMDNDQALSLLQFDYKNRKVLHRMCEEIQLSGLVHDRKQHSHTLSNCFVGAELMTWITKSGIIIGRSDAEVLCNLLLRSGLIDVVKTTKTATAAKTTGARDRSEAVSGEQYDIYRFRCDPANIKKANKSGWLDKVGRWLVLRRFFTWDSHMHRLSYFDNNKAAVAEKVYVLDASTSIQTLDQKSKSGNSKYYFQITLSSPQNSERAILLAANSLRERKDWLRALWLSGCSYPGLATNAAGPLDDHDDDEPQQSSSSTTGGKGLRVDTDTGKQQRDVEAVVMREFTLLRAKMRLKLANAFANLHVPQTNNQFKVFLASLDGPVIIEKRRFEPFLTSSASSSSLSSLAAQAAAAESTSTTEIKQDDKSTAPNTSNSNSSDDKGTSPAALPSMFKSNDNGDDDNDPARAKARQETEQKLEKLAAYIRSLLESPSNPIGQLFATYVRLYRGLYEGALYPRVDNSSPPPTPTRPPTLPSSSSMSSFPSSISTDDFGTHAISASSSGSGVPTNGRANNHSPDFFVPMTPIPASSVPVTSGVPASSARTTSSSLVTHSPLSGSPASSSPLSGSASSPTTASMVGPGAIAANGTPVSGPITAVSMYPYTKHLKRVLKSALEDTRSFLSHMGVVLASDAVFGGTSSLLAADITRVAHDTVSSQLFECILPSLFPLYITANTSSDASLDKRRADFQHIRFSRLGLSASLCLDEPDVEMASRLPKKKKSPNNNSAASSSSTDGSSSSGTAESKNSVSVEMLVPPAPGYGQRDDHGRLKNPYQLAIDQFKKLSSTRDPVAKLDAVVAVAKAICVCVDQYRPSTNGGGVVIGADDLLILFTYIITYADVPYLMAEMNFMDDYMDDKHRCMMTGYYLATTQASTELIMTHDISTAAYTPDELAKQAAFLASLSLSPLSSPTPLSPTPTPSSPKVVPSVAPSSPSLSS